MGGNALKNCYTRRYEKEEYENLKTEVVDLLKNSLYFYDIAIPQSYRNKKTFGDMDIVVRFNQETDLKSLIKQLFNSKELVSNGDCISFEYKEFQIDLIKEDTYFKTKLEYLNWNDVNNLIGRIAHKFGLKYGHQGLVYVIKNESGYRPKEILLSDNMKLILEFLGFDVDTYSFGFDNLIDIYNFVINSKFFNSEIFSFEDLNHINRVRNRKRPTYQGFIDYINEPQIKEYIDNKKQFQFNQDKSTYLNRLDLYFPQIKIYNFIDSYNKEIEVQDKIKDKFSGGKVAQLTGLTGQELGYFIAYFKKNFEENNNFDQWILATTVEEIEKSIKDSFITYNQTKL